jgi:hypothetical protein
MRKIMTALSVRPPEQHVVVLAGWESPFRKLERMKSLQNKTGQPKGQPAVVITRKATLAVAAPEL